MSWLMAKIYDPFMRATEEACLAQWRSELLAQVHGAVLEIGAGTGVNLAHYPAFGIDRLVLLEPDEHMRSQIVADALRGDLLPEVIDGSADVLPFGDETFDFVVGTLVLCTVPDPARVLAEVRRVLKPGGALVFLEHVAASNNPGRLKWQRRVEPMWKHVAGGCHLCRNTAQTIAESGLRIEGLKAESMRKALPILRPTIRGLAIK